MLELSKLIWRVSLAEEPERPWAIVLAGGRGARLRPRFDLEDGRGKRFLTSPARHTGENRDSRDELLERHRDRQWH